MGGYAKTGPFTNNVTPPGISAAFLNAVESVLARGTGDTETGKYQIYCNAFQTNANISCWVVSLSRTSAPVSVSIDETDFAHTNMGAAATTTLNAGGFLAYGAATGSTNGARVAGNYTITY